MILPYDANLGRMDFSERTGSLPQGDIELMAQKQILSLKPVPRPDQIANEYSKCVQNRKHRCQ